MSTENPESVLLAGIVGSTACGLAGPDSDVDRLRLVKQGHELYTTGYVRVRLADPERYRVFGERLLRVRRAFWAETETETKPEAKELAA